MPNAHSTPPAPAANGSPANGAPERIAKAIARAGLCSRRDAERWIAEGRVSLNGEILTSPAVTVTADSDIRVDGKKLPEPERPRLWRYHKPVGLVTTHRDEKGRPTVFGALPVGLPRLISVGRLDLNSEGLLLLTNDGELARKLELPSNGWIRRYRRSRAETRKPAPWRGNPPVSDELWARVEDVRRSKTRAGGPRRADRVVYLDTGGTALIRNEAA